MTCNIRQYSEKDLNAVLNAWEAANQLAHPFLSESFVDQVRNDIPNLYLSNADTWVADVNGKVVGFIALIGNEVGAIFVEPKFHSAGVGRALMDKANELHQSLEVEVFKDNAIGRKFYSNYGFSVLSEAIHESTGNIVLRLRL